MTDSGTLFSPPNMLTTAALKIARAVVHVAFVARAQPLVDLVRFHVGDGQDFLAVELLDACVGDRLLLVLADPILREVHEGLERAVVSVDV